jgi:hypothetical protein
LLVGFPSSPRQSGNEQSTSKSVSFATSVHGVYIKYSSSLKHAKWYSEEEQTGFQRVMLRDVLICSRKLASCERSDLTVEDHIRCVGLDHLISRDVMQRYADVRDGRRQHVRAVLEAQDRQRRRSVNSPEDLAHISSESSRAARMRSYRIARFVGSITE